MNLPCPTPHHPGADAPGRPVDLPTDLPVDLPDVLAELQAAFIRYEAALRDNDVAQLDAFFWPDVRVVRYGVDDAQHGFEALSQWRRTAPPVGAARRTERTVITTFGTALGVAQTEFRNTPEGPVGRQTQTWVRGPAGWRIVAAHVSLPLSAHARSLGADADPEGRP